MTDTFKTLCARCNPLPSWPDYLMANGWIGRPLLCRDCFKK